MSACLIALAVLAVMSIFSAKYRGWAREALDCVARRITLRPCKTSFNEKVKAKVVTTMMSRNHRVASFTYRHFESISWVFTIILFISLGYTVYGVANLAMYGTCDPANPDACVFSDDPSCSPECTPCQCGDEEIGCEHPAYLACEGECTCTEVCESLGT